MRIILADDRPRVRAALRLLLEQEPGNMIVAEAADATGLFLALQSQVADLLLLDWELPGMPASSLLPLIRSRQPLMRILALSGRPEARAEARAHRVDSFVSKGDPPENVLAAVRACARSREEGEKSS